LTKNSDGKVIVKFLIVVFILLCVFLGPFWYKNYKTLVRPMKQVYYEIEKVKDVEQVWQSAELTERRGKGDCKDHVILLLDRLGKDGDYLDFTVVQEKSGGAYHAVLMGHTIVLDPTFGRMYKMTSYLRRWNIIQVISRGYLKQLTSDTL